MTTYTITTEQSFGVTYSVEADSPEEAWEVLVDNDDAECHEQIPGPIVGKFEDANITASGTG